MAVSDSIKVDLLLKKLYGVSKTDTSTNKSPSNEATSSPLLIRGDTIWTQANSIPATAAPLAGIVQSYLATSKIQCVADTTTQRIGGTVYPTWKTNLTDWISTEFDTVNLINTYRVKVYYGNAGLSDPATTGGTQIFADGSSGTGEWYFDYQSGVLNLIGGTIPSGMTASHVIYIYGYQYVGSKSVNVLQAPLNSNISLTTTGTGVVAINSDSITTDRTTVSLLNTTATTVNAFGAAPTINIGATTGTLTIRNADTVVTGDLAVNGGDITTSATAFNLLNSIATNVSAFGAATAVTIGATTGTLTVRNLQTVFSSTDSIQLPVGTIAQRDSTPAIGQVRYNSELSSFEGFGPGNAWGNLGGVKDVDGNTYILAELTPAANDNTLWFYNNGVQTLTITQTAFDLKSPVVMTINNTTNSTSNTTGALVVAGGVGVANDIVGAGPTVSSIQQFEIDEGEY